MKPETQTPEPNNEQRGQHQKADASKPGALTLKERVVAALRTVHDPEIPVNIYDLGLVYELEISNEGYVEVEMTLTSPTCPVAEEIPIQVRAAIESIEGVAGAIVRLVWEPPWDQSSLSDAARLELGLL